MKNTLNERSSTLSDLEKDLEAARIALKEQEKKAETLRKGIDEKEKTIMELMDNIKIWTVDLWINKSVL